jgi:hypothetical protein
VPVRRVLVLFFVGLSLAFAATSRLYLKDGTYQLVREYKVLADRVRYYTVERGDWEEIPLELVDLKRTEAEVKSREDSTKEEAAALAVEEKAERQAAGEVAKVPVNTGAYLVDGAQIKTIPPAEITLVMDKKRRILQVLTPAPILSGKGWVEIKGETSKNIAPSNMPEFYIRLEKEERFGILRLTSMPAKGIRILERVSVIPVSKEIMEEQDQVQVFRRQLGEGLYKIWPMKALEPGEYAVVEFTPAETEGIKLQSWDFSVRPK